MSRKRVAASWVASMLVMATLYGCPAPGGSPSTPGADGGSSACVALQGTGLGLTRASFQVPTRLRTLAESGCLSSLPKTPSVAPWRALPPEAEASGADGAAATAPADTGPIAPDAGPLGPELDWNWSTANASWPVAIPGAPVTGTAALYVASYPTQSNTNDRLFYGSNTTRGTNFFALNNLYAAAPSVAWSATNGGLDGTSVATSLDGSRVYAVDSQGNLSCYAAATGGLCTGWATQAFSPNQGASLSSPWVDFASNAIYYGDLSGRVYKVSELTGLQIWSVDLSASLPSPCAASACGKFGIHSSPVLVNGFVYVGTDAGAMFRITDPGATAPTTIASQWLCAAPTAIGCGSAWAVYNGPSVDNVLNLLYASANGKVFEYPLTGTWAYGNSVDLGTAAGYPVYSSPIIDWTNGYLYVGYYNRLYKMPYPFTGATTAVSTAMGGVGPDPSYPHSSVVPYAGTLFIGDGAGSAEQFGCMTSASAPSRTSQTIAYGTEVDTSPVVDFGTGNVNFGYSNATTGGGLVQITQSSIWGCSPGKQCGTAGCGGTAKCVSATSCCVAADCGAAPTNGSVACTGDACVTACNSGYNVCGAQCLLNTTCCTDANCTSPAVCPSVGGTCGAGQSIALNFNIPTGAGIQSVVATVAAPVTTLTTGTVTFTQASTTVTGSGTTFMTSFHVGQRISLDGVNFYGIAAVGSNTSLTLSAAYALATASAVATYYEADCIAGQVCPSTKTITLNCSTSATCTTSTALALGDYKVTAKAYAGLNGTGLVEAANINDNKFRITGGGNDLTTTTLNLVRVYPIGVTGNDATCPLNLTVDPSGNVWTANGNGYSNSNCTGPTNNLTKLVKASSFAPTIISNPGIAASPEGIVSDATGAIWVTVPSLSTGIFKLTTTGTTAAGFPVGGSGGCQTPRGVALDPFVPSKDGAYTACYGTLVFPGAGGRRIARWSAAGTLSSFHDVTESADQPVSVVAQAIPGLTQDYACNQGVYINRSSTSSVLVSRLQANLGGTMASFTQSASTDEDPYGLTVDGGGTAWAVERRTGSLLNVEGTTNPLTKDNLTAGAALPAPWAIAADNQYVISGGSCPGTFAQNDLWVSHSGNNTVTRFGNTILLKNNYIVGSTPNPGPRGIIFDSSTTSGQAGSLWVANSAEGTLSRIWMRLSVESSDTNNGGALTCPGTVAVGSTISIPGTGFDTTALNNTVLVAGYLGTVTAATATSLTVRVPPAVSGVALPITVSNSGGHAVTSCKYTTI